MRVFAVLFIWCLAASICFGQTTGTVAGRVKGNPTVAGAKVILEQNGRTVAETIADSEGQYSFDVVLPGRYNVRVGSANQVDRGAARTVTVAAGEPTIVDLLIGQSNCGTVANCPTIRETVTVSANALQSVEEVAKTVDVIDGQEMRDRADISLTESLRTIPGFRIQQLGGFGRTASIKTRGLRNQDTAVLIDGIRFRDPAAISGDATPFLSDITLTSVSRVEVLRGSGSSLYGTNAIGGVVDFQTPRARNGVHGQISGAGGGLGMGRFRGNLSYGQSDRFGIGGGVSRTVYKKGIDGDDDAENTNFQTRLDAAPWRSGTISARIFLSDAGVGLNTEPDTIGMPAATNASVIDARQGINFAFDANDPDKRQESRVFSGQISGTQSIGTAFLVRGYFQSLSTDRQNDDGPLGPGFQSASTSLLEGHIDTANVSAGWTIDNRHTVTAGYEFETERFRNEGRTPSGTGNFFSESDQRSHTFFFQGLFGFLDDRLQAAAGYRRQTFRLGVPEFSLTGSPFSNVRLSDPPPANTFDGAVSYRFVSGTKLRAHLGNGYRVPSLYERFGTFFSTFPTPGFILLGDPDLEPERSTAADAGVEQSLYADRLRLSATYFYTKLNNTVGFGNVVRDVGPTIRTFGGYENVPGGISRGAELSARARTNIGLDLFTSYTYTNSDQRRPQVSGNGSVQTLGVPEHQLTAVAAQRIGKLWLSLDVLITSSYLAPIFSNSSFTSYVYRFKGNRRADLTAGYTFDLKEGRSVRLFGTVENLFDNRYFENGFRTPGVNGRVGVNFGF